MHPQVFWLLNSSVSSNKAEKAGKRPSVFVEQRSRVRLGAIYAPADARSKSRHRQQRIIVPVRQEDRSEFTKAEPEFDVLDQIRRKRQIGAISLARTRRGTAEHRFFGGATRHQHDHGFVAICWICRAVGPNDLHARRAR